jgi:hypothetical protein
MVVRQFSRNQIRRRGLVTIEHVLTTVVFLIMAGLAMRESFKLLRLFHHVILTLVGWPIL